MQEALSISQRLAETHVHLDDAEALLGETLYAKLLEELELLEIAGDDFTREGFLAGEISPVFWGSALTNFGIEPLLNFLSDRTASPAARQAFVVDSGRAEEETPQEIQPEDDGFSGFIFKIQANMNPRHRDRVAFMRVVSGRFERGIDVTIGRSGEALRLSKPHTFMAQERSIVEEAFPGDIVGLYDPGKLRIGDTLAAGRRLKFSGIPRFAPEHFARVILRDPMKRKQLDAGLTQLSHEGVIQLFYRPDIGRQDPFLGAVGVLQFEVLKARLENEYRVNVDLERLSFQFARWVGGGEEALAWLLARRDYPILRDRNEQPVLLSDSEWAMQYALQNAPGLKLYEVEPL